MSAEPEYPPTTVEYNYNDDLRMQAIVNIALALGKLADALGEPGIVIKDSHIHGSLHVKQNNLPAS